MHHRDKDRRVNVAPPLVGGAPSLAAATEKQRYSTWGRNRSVRLDGFDYREHFPYHVTICARVGTIPFERAPIAEMVCTILQDYLKQSNAYLGAFCLMPDHLHVLLSPDRSELTLGQLIGRFKGLTTNASWKLGWSGPLWQARFYDHIVRNREGTARVGQYVYENSDRAGLPVDYPYRYVAGDLI